MTVKAGDPKPLVHGEAEEAIQLNTRLVGRKKKTVLIIINYLINLNLFQSCVNNIELQLCMSATCPSSIARVHRSLESVLINKLAYINQLEGISNLKEMQ